MYALQVKINQEIYYLVDTKGMISRSLQDAMIFPEESCIEGFDWISEVKYEKEGESFQVTATSGVVEVELTVYGWKLTNLEH